MLIVEDSSADVALIRQSLRHHGIELEAVVMSDGEKAVRFVDSVEAGESKRPEIIVLDLNLPKIMGIEVLEKIRKSPAFGNIPVVVFTSSIASKDKEASARLGANRYIRKPLSFEEYLTLGEVLKSLLKVS